MPAYIVRALKEGAFMLLGACAVYGVLCLASYDHADLAGYGGVDMGADTPEPFPGRGAGGVHNVGGVIGAWLSYLLLFTFGLMAYVFPPVLVYLGWLIHRWRSDLRQFAMQMLLPRGTGFLLALLTGSGLATMHFFAAELPAQAGGVAGAAFSKMFVGAFGFAGATLLQLALFLTAVSLAGAVSWLSVMDETGRYTFKVIEWSRERVDMWRDLREGERARTRRHKTMLLARRQLRDKKPPKISPLAGPAPVGEKPQQEKQANMFAAAETDGGRLPPFTLLDGPRPLEGVYSEEALAAISRLVELKFKDFNIEVAVDTVLPGPVITRFELMPAPGLKVSRVTGLTKDIARALSVPSVRVVEVIPGKSVIGLEIPNENREMVVLSEVIKSRDYERSGSPLTLALGKDIAGLPVIADLGKMPHLLVAGTTGSGKSVAVNAMILSLLYKSAPSDVRMIMIDPKMLELSIYQGIPHLLAPVVTDMGDASNALRWCVAEMERRYQLMAALGVRNISGYNRKIKQAEAAGAPLADPLWQAPAGRDAEAPSGPARPLLQTLPFIVVIVDELADMMMMVGKKVEELIARLAQKARASGIHLVLATQRPSVDVITGLIKANIPTRIAFQVSSKVDSRTILDQMGAEQLLGHGDMLYLPAGASIPTRIHGAFVSDEEVHNVVGYIKAGAATDYDERILRESAVTLAGEKPTAVEADDIEADPLYDEAVQFVIESRRASISAVQRKLKVGYNRAARMIERMETAGLVSPPGHNGNREVLTPEQDAS